MVGGGVALFATGGLTAACGGGQGGGGNENGFQFTAWSLNEEASKGVIQDIVDGYSEKNGVRIETASYPYEEYLNQILLQARGGNVSGAAQLDINWLSTLAAQGSLVDLGSAAEGTGYTEAALSSGRVDATQYGLPWTTGAIGMIANSELLEEAGISEMPKTIEEFEKALEALKGIDGVTPYAAMTDVASLKDVIPWMWTYGSDVVKDGEVILGDEGSVWAVEWYKSLLDRKYAAPGVDRFDARALFSQGKVGFYDDAVVAKGALTTASDDPDLAEKIVPVPRPTEGSGDPQSLLWGHLVVVFDGEGAEPATEFARHLTSDTDTVVGYFEDLSLPPTTEEALEAEAAQNDEYTNTFTEQITAFARPGPFAPYPEYARMESILGEQVQVVIAGEASAQEAMDRAKEEISAMIG